MFRIGQFDTCTQDFEYGANNMKGQLAVAFKNSVQGPEVKMVLFKARPVLAVTS